MTKPLFALVDCNNFFVSCERVFRPDLEGKPVVVLSSNDGCVVARSNEVKALGISMAAPAFKYRHVFKQHNVVQFSANFSLYGDISRRIIDLLATITPRIEVYSVDESFLDISELPISDYEAWGVEVRQKILDWIGIPVSIGIAPTKTLAKLASDYAKTMPNSSGVLCLDNQEVIHDTLNVIPIKNIWGVGWRLAPRLRAEGITTAWQLHRMRPQHAKQMMGIHGSQMVAELNGIPCLKLDMIGKLPQSIARTRTFDEDTNDYNAIESAIASFVTRAAYQLRTSRQLTKRVSIFLTNNKHRPGYRYWTKEIKLTSPTADTGRLLTVIIEALDELFSASIYYHRAGICLYDFIPIGGFQPDLFGCRNPATLDKSLLRMQAIDAINDQWGKEHIGYAAEKLGNAWQPKYKLRSPRYVTHWGELPKLHIR